MQPLKNDRFIKALRWQTVDRPPIWFMRQAGRYLPEYRAIRAQAGNFLTLCKTPELATAVTLQPIARFDLDAAILFSDILVIPDAMGLELSVVEGTGPAFATVIRDAHDLKQLRSPDIKESLAYVLDTIGLIKQQLQQTIPLIGFCGSPWTLATYMIEGKTSKDFHEAKKFMYCQPQALQQLLELLTDTLIQYLRAQIEAGCDCVMVFDTWGGILSGPNYEQFSLCYMQKIVNALKHDVACKEIPIILFTKNGGLWLEQISQTGCDCIGLDWTIDLQQARDQIKNRVALQGNLEPAVLYAPTAFIEQKINSLLSLPAAKSGYVFNLGHGILPDVPVEHVHCMVNAVKNFTIQD